MIFLDIEVPEYESMRTQEHKVPELIKTLRGKGTLENSNEFGYEDRLHLNFTVNEYNLRKLLKVYSRFQTLCLIPMYNSNLKHKIYDAYLQYQKNNLQAMFKSIEDNSKDYSELIEKVYSKNPTETYLKSIKEYGYKVNPNANDCIMVFLESFSFKSVQDSSDGYEVEMILWVCNDLTFYNGDEISFLEEYYKQFASKKEAFERIDKIIDDLFENKKDNINIAFSNIYNDQKTYSANKQVEKIAEPTNIIIPNKYITQVEIRAMNNLHRIPLVAKTKGFVQHLGKGEVGVTVKLVFNQKNALTEKIIHDIKSISLYQQEYITTSESDFYLFKGMDLKELSLSTNIIEEPSDDVDVTVLTLFFTAAGTNKAEVENNYFSLMERGNSTISIGLFNNFLDRVLSYEDRIEINPSNENKNSIPYYENTYSNKFDEFSKMIISKSDKKNSTIETGNGNEITTSEEDFTLSILFRAYRQELFWNYKYNYDNDNDVFVDEINQIDYEVKAGVLKGIGQFFFSGGVPKDSLFLDSVLFRIQRLAFKMRNTYYKTLTETEKKVAYDNLFQADNETQANFVEKIFTPFLSEYFNINNIIDNKHMFVYAISNVFKIEVINNLIPMLKEILEEDWKNHNLFDIGNTSEIEIINENGDFDNRIKDTIKNSIIKCFDVISNVVDTNSFVSKAVDFVIENYYYGMKETDRGKITSTVEKAISQENINFKERLNTFINDISVGDNSYLLEVVELIFKLQILGCRSEKFVKIDERIVTDNQYIRERSFNRKLLQEAQIYLLCDCILSLLIVDLNYEKSVVGVLATESAKNFVGPYVVTYTAIEATLNEITSKLYAKLNGQTLDEYISNPEIEESYRNDATEYKFLYDKLQVVKRIFEITFRDKTNDLLTLNKTFIRTSQNNLDFQKAHDVSVFEDFDSPMSFLKQISSGAEKYKELFKNVNEDLKYLEEYSQNINIENAISEESDESIKKLIDKCISVFAPATLVADLTINKNKPGDTQPSTFMHTELLSEMKLMRGMRSATRMLTSQYEKMMPNYEIYIIDEKAIQDSFEKGYDYNDKIYSISNVVSINIKKDDATNLKHAVVKIMNTLPHYIDLSTVFESQSVFNDNSLPTAVYGNKFQTNKIIFKAGLIINISLDRESQFYDFTGKIEAVEISNNIITLRCSSFAAELLGAAFDVNNVYATGFTGLGTKFLNLFRKFKRTGENIAKSNSNVEFLNGHLIPSDFIDGKATDETYKPTLAGASGILYTALDKSIQSIKHLDCSYNDLISGKNLSDNIKGMDSALGSLAYNLKDSDDVTSHRITENLNAVEFDTSFYGIQVLKENVNTQTGYAPVAGLVRNQTGNYKTLLGHSSFVTKNLDKEMLYPNSYSGSVFYTTNGEDEYEFDGLILGNCYSYKREGVKLYDVLNDLNLRNPAAYWDVYESGNYGTLFFGRNNYMITRKNKTASLSREDVDKITELTFSCFKDESFSNKYLSAIEYVEALNYLSEIASVYDQNFAKTDKIQKNLMGQKIRSARLNNSFFKDVTEMNKDLYEEESPVSNIILAISGYNLVSCTISTNENYINTVDIKYKPGLGDRISRFTDMITGKSSKIRLKSFENLPDERIRVKSVDPVLTTDLHTKEQAFEYAQAVMNKELIDYYSGKIVILYKPDIKKNDEVLLIDSRNKISGTVVVKDFEHIFDVESGALTIIVPGMKVKTSSLMTDVYLTGLINQLEYEWMKRKTYKYPTNEIGKVNQQAAADLKQIFGDLFEQTVSIPVAFECIGYDYKFDTEAYDKSFEQKTGEIVLEDGSKKTQVVENIKTKDVAESIITPRNVSNLPFKIYPLIKNGRPLMPDEDIYNSVERPFSFVTRLITTLNYMRINALNIDRHLDNISSLISDLWSEFDLSREGTYKEIVKKYFSAFVNPNDRDKLQFINKMIADDYNIYGILDDYNINVDRYICERDSIVFFNCQKLNQYEDERIERIARILCQFQVVNLVELDGRITDNGKADGKVIGHETGNLTVVNKLIEYMNQFNNTDIIKPKSKNKSWTAVIQERLIENPYEEYDDVGAVLINCDSTTANNIITNLGRKTITAEINFNGPSKKTMYAINYKLNIKSNYSNNIAFNIFVYHNYYGRDLGQESESYEMRTSLMDSLMKTLRDEAGPQSSSSNYWKKNVLLLGDFNLHLRDKNSNLFDVPDFINEYYDLFKFWGEDFEIGNSDLVTTTGNKKYDYIVTVEDNIIRRLIEDKTSVMYYTSAYFTDVDLVSDHYPVYMTFKKAGANKFSIIYDKEVDKF